MATNATAEGCDIVYKCRKCRWILFTGETVVSAHGIPLLGPNSEDFGCESCADESTIWYLNEEALPSWIESLLNKDNWIKGKILCPKCSARIGSFDFVSGSKCSCGQYVLPSTHVVKSKVDCNNVAAAFPTMVLPQASVTIAEKHETECSKENPDVDGEKVCKAPTDVAESVILSDSRAFGLDALVISEDTLQNHTIISQRLRIKTGSIKSPSDHTFEHRQPMLVEEPPEELVCPVCLDVFHHPFICYPCTHVFCESCLRRLARVDPQRTPCPLCRQFIGMCLPDSDRCRRAKLTYPKSYKMRQKILQRTQNFPLPWQPHYRLRQLSSLGQSILWGRIQGDADANVVRTLWETLSTISLLVVLHIIALVTFLVGYHGCHYVPQFITWFVRGLEHVASGTDHSWMPMWLHEAGLITMIFVFITVTLASLYNMCLHFTLVTS